MIFRRLGAKCFVWSGDMVQKKPQSTHTLFHNKNCVESSVCIEIKLYEKRTVRLIFCYQQNVSVIFFRLTSDYKVIEDKVLQKGFIVSDFM